MFAKAPLPLKHIRLFLLYAKAGVHFATTIIITLACYSFLLWYLYNLGFIPLLSVFWAVHFSVGLLVYLSMMGKVVSAWLAG